MILLKDLILNKLDNMFGSKEHLLLWMKSKKNLLKEKQKLMLKLKVKDKEKLKKNKRNKILKI
jgi:hypothetical protein